MVSLIHSYEQQYSILTADITSKIGRLKYGGDDDNEALCNEIQSNFDEANELLEQLQLECQGTGAASRVGAYRAELGRIKEEFKSAFNKTAKYNLDEDFDDWSASNDQHQKLIDNTERIENTGNRLTEGYRVILETEQIGAAVLQDLSSQRETIQRARGRLRETDEELNRSSRLMNSMIVRTLQDRFILVIVFLVIGILMCLGLYFYIT